MLTRSRSHSREESEAVSDSQTSSGYSSSLSQSQSQEDRAPKEDYVPKRKKSRGRGLPVQPDQWICLMPGTPHIPSPKELNLFNFANYVEFSFQIRYVDLATGVAYLLIQHFPWPPSVTQEQVYKSTVYCTDIRTCM
jgi:hypothetical protein